jgi:hypothetical protein
LLETPALYLGVRMPSATSVDVKNGRQLYDLWARGEHLDRVPVLQKRVAGQPLWSFVDPASPLAQALRSEIAAAASVLRGRLEAVRDGRSLAAVARGATLPGVRSCVERVLSARAPAEVARVTEAWRRELADPANVDAMTEATIITRQERSVRTRTEDHASQSCFISVRNAHDIFVDAAVLGGKTARIEVFSPFVTVTPAAEIERLVTTNQRGFVCVAANDYVTVFAAVAHADRGLETGALLRALDQVVPGAATDCQ